MGGAEGEGEVGGSDEKRMGGSEIEVEIQIREQQSGGREQEAWKEHVVLILPEKKKWHEPFLHRSFKFCE